jgi:hypothetical protein
MVYQLESKIILFEVNRTAILDISPGDVIQASCLPDADYKWTEQDSQFVESNPDARLFIRFEKEQNDAFRGIGVMILPEAVY